MQQQLKISKFEHQGFSSPSNLPTPTMITGTADIRGIDAPESQVTVNESTKVTESRGHSEQVVRGEWEQGEERAEREAREAREQAERETRERDEKTAMERMDKISKRIADIEAAKKAEQEARRRAKRGHYERVRQEAREKIERDVIEQIELEEKEEAEQEARERAEREMREGVPPALGSTIGKNGDHSRKTPTFPLVEQKNERGSSWGLDSTEKKDESSGGLPPIITSSVPGGIFEGAGHFDFFANKDSPGGAELGG